MATFYSNKYSYETVSATYILTESVGKRSGDVIAVRANCVCDAALATNDTQRIGIVPYNCKLIGVKIANEDWGTTVTTKISITDGSTTTDLKTGMAFGTAGAIDLTYAECTNSGALIAPVAAAAGALLFFTFTSVTTPTAAANAEVIFLFAQA